MAKKRSNKEGSLFKRKDGRWAAQVTLPDGKRKYYYGQTRQEVARRLVQAQNDLERGLPLPDERQTVEQYLLSWIKIVKSQLRLSAWRRYHDHVRLHLIPGLGKVALSRLTAQQVQLFYAKEINAGLSTTTVHHLHATLHRALDDALKLGLVQRNVTEMVRAPRRQHYEMQPLSEEQARQFRAAVAGNRFEALYVLAITTGMRIGELLALHWHDVDLEQATLQVRMNLQEAEKKQFIIAETKTDHSRRRIALSQSAIKVLRAHWVRQQEESRRLGAAWEEQDLVFPNAIGGIMIPHNLTKRSFKRYLTKVGLPDIRFHDLRHTAATILLSRGVNVKVVSEMLGHADISITLRVYVHVIPHMQQAAADVMDVVLHWLEEGEVSSKQVEKEHSSE